MAKALFANRGRVLFVLSVTADADISYSQQEGWQGEARFGLSAIRQRERALRTLLRGRGAEPVIKEEGSVIIYCSVGLEMIPTFDRYVGTSRLHADLHALFPEWKLQVAVTVGEEYSETVYRFLKAARKGDLDVHRKVWRFVRLPKAQRYHLRTKSGELYVIFTSFKRACHYLLYFEFHRLLRSPAVLAGTKGWEEAASDSSRVASIEYMGHVDAYELRAFSRLAIKR
jgi:hypothetical protein